MSRPSALYTFLKPKPVPAERTEPPAAPTLDQSVQTRILLQSSAINTLLDGFVSKINASSEQLQDLSKHVNEHMFSSVAGFAELKEQTCAYEVECSARHEQLHADLEQLHKAVEMQGRNAEDAQSRIHGRIDGLELSLKTITHQLQSVQAAIQPLAQLAPLLQHVIDISTNATRAPHTYRNPPSSLSANSASAGSSSSIPESRNSSSLAHRSDQSASSLSSESAQRMAAPTSFQPIASKPPRAVSEALNDNVFGQPKAPAPSTSALPPSALSQKEDATVYLPPIPARPFQTAVPHAPSSAEKRKRPDQAQQSDLLPPAPATPKKSNALRTETSVKKSAKKRRILISESQEEQSMTLSEDLREVWPEMPQRQMEDDDETQYEED